MVVFRQAHTSDLGQAYAVYAANQGLSQADMPPLSTPPLSLAHVLRSGTLWIAQERDEILAFAGAITRSGITFLTDLFVRPDQQSARLGQTLLQHMLPVEGIRCTLSSTDPRALALYIRSGMRPQWPHFSLLLADSSQARLPASSLEVVEASADDPALVAWDARVSGRYRPEDHAYWCTEQQASVLWFKRAGSTVGYGYVRPGAQLLAHPAACALGPIGAFTEDEASACVLAAVTWASQRYKTLAIEVPGPHPCLVSLLEARFSIEYFDTYMSSTRDPFFDPTCYIASGADLF